MAVTLKLQNGHIRLKQYGKGSCAGNPGLLFQASSIIMCHSSEHCAASAGVSNFDIDELAELLAMARIKPALVQRHSDPLSADAATQALCRLAGVQYQVSHAHARRTGMHPELRGGAADFTARLGIRACVRCIPGCCQGR